MAGKEETPQVCIEDVKLGKVWDPKACKDVPGWAAASLEKGLGNGVKVVRSKPKQGFVVLATIDPLDYDEKKGELSGKMSAFLTDADKAAKANVNGKASLKGVDAASLQKKLQKLTEAMAEKCGKDVGDEIKDLAAEK